MKMDILSKITLLIIAIGIIGININLIDKNLREKNTTKEHSSWKVIADDRHVYILKNNGEDICNAYTSTSGMITGKWVKTHC